MKSQRQKMVAEIVQRLPIANQEQLVFELARHGVHANQATVSRDVKELGLVKVADPTVGHRYAMPNAGRPRTTWDTLGRTLQEHVSRIDHSDTLIVMKTPPGRAHMVGVVIDLLDSPDIVGTIAGDDTLLLVPRQSRMLEGLVERLTQLWLGRAVGVGT
jgi:transcriptional regulator of arginine metabolism